MEFARKLKELGKNTASKNTDASTCVSNTGTGNNTGPLCCKKNGLSTWYRQNQQCCPNGDVKLTGELC